MPDARREQRRRPRGPIDPRRSRARSAPRPPPFTKDALIVMPCVDTLLTDGRGLNNPLRKLHRRGPGAMP
ncbi:hypothetical protein RR46_04000 [Papilio xuthus]|uniref:Uncharacterized protein n=1 Tax=Papilio xuthus TaxID=66420 RepID=A0A194QHX9_PAPXU|nr:hypothetical protein RR46_04000 [Papilio xuthus]